MNVQLHRKQIIMLILSVLLAIASFWIPLPPRSEPQAPNASIEKSKQMIVVHSFDFTAR